MRRHGLDVLTLISSLMLCVTTLMAQERGVIDEGAFVITEGTTVVGQEEFTIRQGRSGAPDGVTITATATYPPSRPTRAVTVRLELGADSEPVSAEIQDRSDSRRAVVMAFRARRITVRMVTPGGESVREHPRRPRTLLSASSVYSIFHLVSGMTAGDLWAITPSGDPPEAGRLTDLGADRIRVKGVERPLRHVSLDLGSETHHLWFDQQGRLIQVSIPARNLKAVRDNS